MTGEHADWRLQGKCTKLPTDESDKIFFPGPGGKSKKAKEFCKSCPVISQCLSRALAKGTTGFWAGTTEDEREQMRSFEADVAASIPDPISAFLPPEPSRKTRRLRPVPTITQLVHDPLAGVSGPTLIEELQMLES